MAINKKTLSRNIYLQSKRTSYLLDISLTRAKDIVANAVYRCQNFHDLTIRLKNKTLKSVVFPFCRICPSSDSELLYYLDKNIDYLLKRFSVYINFPVSLKMQHDFIYSIFGLASPLQLGSFSHGIKLKNFTYRFSNLPGEGVFVQDVILNDIKFRLLAIRFLSDKILNSDDNLYFLKMHKERILEGIKMPIIIWDNFEYWLKSIYEISNSLSLSFEKKCSLIRDAVIPKCTEAYNFSKEIHAIIDAFEMHFFVDTLQYTCISGNDKYREDTLILGYPVDAICQSENTDILYITECEINNGKVICNIDGGIVALELQKVSDYKMKRNTNRYFFEIFEKCLNLPGATFKTLNFSGAEYLVLLRPSTIYENNLYVKNVPTIRN